RNVQPTEPVALHDERIRPGQPGRTGGSGRWGVVGAPVPVEVRDVVPGPLPSLLVPPHVGLALAPGAPVGPCRSPVVEDAAVRRPSPSPFGGDPRLLAAGLAPRGLVDAVGVDPAVDPAPAAARTVGAQPGLAGQWLAVPRATVDLLQDRRGAGLLHFALSRVVPGQFQDR